MVTHLLMVIVGSVRVKPLFVLIEHNRYLLAAVLAAQTQQILDTTTAHDKRRLPIDVML